MPLVLFAFTIISITWFYGKEWNIEPLSFQSMSLQRERNASRVTVLIYPNNSVSDSYFMNIAFDI